MKVISNTSPLTAFASINKIDLLRDLFSEIYIPKQVSKEFENKSKEINLIRNVNVSKLEWVKTVQIKNKELCKYLNLYIHRGEAEAIVLYGESKGNPILLDDKKARKIAKVLGLNIIGTVGILGLALQKEPNIKMKP